MKIRKIEARDIPDLWFQAIYDIPKHGKRFIIERGSNKGQTRLEYDYFIGIINQPWYGSGTPVILPYIPLSIGIPNPVEFEYIYGGKNYKRSYIEYLMTDIKMPNESYTYGERLVAAKSPFDMDWWDFKYMGSANDRKENRNHLIDETKELIDQKIIYFKSDKVRYNQIELAIWTYKNHGCRNNQVILQIAQPGDFLLAHPPCLRHIDTRIQNGKLHFFVYFRSWDLWAGLPANLAAIVALQQYMADSIGVAYGKMIVESKGLHLYKYAERLAAIRCLKDLKEE